MKHIKILKILSMLALIFTILFAVGCSESSHRSTNSYRNNSSFNYILDKNKKTIHKPRCYLVGRINSNNREGTDSYSFAVSRGFTPCGNCNPQFKFSLLSLLVYVVLRALSLAPIFIITCYSRNRLKMGLESPKTATLIIIMLVSEILIVSALEALYYCIFDTKAELPLYLTILFGTCFIIKFAHDEFRIVDGTVISFSLFKHIIKKKQRQILKEPGHVKMPRPVFNSTVKLLWGAYPLVGKEIKTTAETESTSHLSDDALFCRKCGAKLFSDSTFCHKCGTEVITKDE